MIRIYVEFTSKKKQSSETPAAAESASKEFDSTPITETIDSDTEVRQRHVNTAKTEVSKDHTGKDNEAEEDKRWREGHEFNIALLLPAASSLGLCVAGGAVIHVFPDVLYARLLDFSTDNPDGVWQLTEVSFTVAFLAAVDGLALSLLLIALLGRRWVWPALLSIGMHL